jgi:hypothetical protein
MKCMFEFKDLTCAEFEALTAERLANPTGQPDVDELDELLGMFHAALRCDGTTRPRCAMTKPEEPK